MSRAPTFDDLKIPPHSVEAEQSVLGALLLSGQYNNLGNKDAVLGLLEVDDFYRQNHRLIFKTVRDLFNRNEPVDILTVMEELKSQQELDNAGGLTYLAELAKNTYSIGNMQTYAGIVREKANLRAVLAGCTDITGRVFEKGADSKAIIEKAVQLFFLLESKGARGTKNFSSMKSILRNVLAKMEERAQAGDVIIGERTGLDEFDKLLSGLEKGKLYIVAARPRVGKTTLAMTIAEHFALQNNPVAFFSQEMPELSLGNKVVASQGRVDYSAVRSAQLDEDQWARVASAFKKMADVPFYVDDSSAISPADIRSRCRRLMVENKHQQLGLIVIDYLGLMRPSGDKEFPTENARISDISRELMSLKKEFDCPIILLCQLNRDCEKRPNKRPVLSDLRDSGSLEQDANAVIFLYRDELYNDDSPEKGIAEVIIAKNRDGEEGTVRLAFSGKYQRYDNLACDSYYQGGWN